MELIPAKGIVG